MCVGLKRSSWSMQCTRPVRRAASSISPASVAFMAMGFSQSTCLPASSAASTMGRCRYGGVAMLTRSTSGSLSSSR